MKNRIGEKKNWIENLEDKIEINSQFLLER